jgi:hypothetical protein
MSIITICRLSFVHTIFIFRGLDCLSLTCELVAFWFFQTVSYSQDCSAPEDESSLLSKRRVCVLSDDGKSSNTHQCCLACYTTV